MEEVQPCPLCKGTKHQRFLEGEGTSQAKWVYKACVCVLRERWRLHLGVFAKVKKMEQTPLLGYEAKNLCCMQTSLDDMKVHVGCYLRKRPLEYRYLLLDIRRMGALYVSEGQEGDEEVYQGQNLVIIALNLTAIRSVKADDLLCRALQYRSLGGQPVWIFYSGQWGDFQGEFAKASRIVERFDRLVLTSLEGSVPPPSHPSSGKTPPVTNLGNYRLG